MTDAVKRIAGNEARRLDCVLRDGEKSGGAPKQPGMLPDRVMESQHDLRSPLIFGIAGL